MNEIPKNFQCANCKHYTYVEDDEQNGDLVCMKHHVITFFSDGFIAHWIGDTKRMIKNCTSFDKFTFNLRNSDKARAEFISRARVINCLACGYGIQTSVLSQIFDMAISGMEATND